MSRGGEESYHICATLSLTAVMLIRFVILIGMVVLCLSSLDPGAYLGVEALLSVACSTAMSFEIAVWAGKRTKLDHAVGAVASMASAAAPLISPAADRRSPRRTATRPPAGASCCCAQPSPAG